MGDPTRRRVGVNLALKKGNFLQKANTSSSNLSVEILEITAGNSRSDGQIWEQSNIEVPYDYERSSSPVQVANKAAVSQVTLKEVVLGAKDEGVDRGEYVG